MIYTTTKDINVEDIKYYVLGYIDSNNELHFKTNCINSIFMLGMIEHIKIEGLDFIKQFVKVEDKNDQ